METLKTCCYCGRELQIEMFDDNMNICYKCGGHTGYYHKIKRQISSIKSKKKESKGKYKF